MTELQLQTTLVLDDVALYLDHFQALTNTNYYKGIVVKGLFYLSRTFILAPIEGVRVSSRLFGGGRQSL